MHRVVLIPFFLLLMHSISMAQDPSMAIYMDNPAYTAANQFEFDVMVKSMGNTSVFQLRTFQAGVYVDANWVGSGSLSGGVVTGYSALLSPGYNSNFNWNSTDKLMNMSVNLDVRTIAQGCISTTVGVAPLRIARIRLINTVPFACAPPNLKFNYLQNTTPLRLRTTVSWRLPGCSVNYDLFYPNRTFTGSVYYNGELFSLADADGRSPASAIGNTVTCVIPYDLNVLLQGYYTGSHSMLPVLLNSGVQGATTYLTDTISVQLRNVTDPSLIVASVKALLGTDGSVHCLFPQSLVGGSYWIVIRHRSSLETWSAMPVNLSSNGSYDFTDASSKAFGGNLCNEGGGVYSVYAGDINRDGFVDNFDYPLFESECIGFSSGYVSSDMNGDGFSDNFDYPILEDNTLSFLMCITP